MIKPAPGSIFEERYKIIGYLGQGGMGCVYHALQQDIKRDVALKLLTGTTINDEESVARFFREFKLLSQLSHPHIVTLYGMALTKDGEPYAICEYLNGRTLRKELEIGSFEWKRAVKICIQICEALSIAHAQGISHRDLKPENVMLVELPEPDFVKLLDFGLSRIYQQATTDQNLTRTGAMIGTPQYMSPEHIAGKPADHRSDIYALACVLFELLHGKYLFSADTPTAILYMHVSSDSLTQLKALTGCPTRLIPVLSKALEKDPDKRYQSISELSKDLSVILEKGDDNELIAGGNKKSSSKFAFIAVAAIIIGGLLISIAKYFQSHPAERLTATHKAEIKTLSATALVSKGINLLNEKRYDESIQKLKEAISRYNPQLDTRCNISAAHIGLSQAYAKKQMYDEQLKETKLGIATEKSAKTKIYNLQILAQAYANLHRPEDMIKEYREALTEFEKLDDPGIELIEAESMFTDLLISQKHYEEAYNWAKKTLATADKLEDGRTYPGCVQASWALADLSKKNGKVKESREELSKTKACLLEGYKSRSSFSTLQRNAVIGLSLYGAMAAYRGYNSEAKETLELAMKEAPHLEKVYADIVKSRSEPWLKTLK